MARIAVIGAGVMGSYTALDRQKAGHEVIAYDKKPSDIIKGLNFASSPKEAIDGADAVLFAVETNNVEQAIMEYLPFAKKGALISGQTSRKKPEASAYERFMSENSESGLLFATIHSMCNPKGTPDPSKDILAIIKHESEEAFEKAREIYASMSSHIELFDSISEHDFAVANTQVNTSRTVLSIASSYARAGIKPGSSINYTNPLDVMKFALAMRAANLMPHVYRDIQMGNEEGKIIVRNALDVESSLFSAIVEGRQKDFTDIVMAARHKIYNGRSSAILSEEDIKQFGIEGPSKPNDHFALIQYFVACAESGRNPFADLKATTPMHTSLLVLADWLFSNEGELEQAIDAAFSQPSLKEDDQIFHDEIKGWSEAILLENPSGYDAKHEVMRKNIPADLLQEEVERSKCIVAVTRRAMNEAIASGKITHILEKI